ncbi:MAG: hypothetical protein FJZ00_14920, partial [Candidatus Sericytochromatia bacterium]|nr:hypothetical protein [Candidatus Tanganyikabacteria bacterium]
DYEVIATAMRALSSTYLGNVKDGCAQAEAWAAKVAAFDEGTQDGLGLTILPYEAERLLFCGQVEEGLAAATRGWHLLEKFGIREYEQRLLTLLGDAALAKGRPDEARAKFGAALDLGLAIGASATAARARKGLAEVALAEGDRDGAADLLAQAYRTADKGGYRFLAGQAAILAGNVALLAGERQSAAGWFDKALTWALKAACRHLEMAAHAGLAGAMTDADAAKHVRAASTLLDQQIAGLSETRAAEYLSVPERAAVRSLALRARGI